MGKKYLCYNERTLLFRLLHQLNQAYYRGNECSFRIPEKNLPQSVSLPSSSPRHFLLRELAEEHLVKEKVLMKAVLNLTGTKGLVKGNYEIFRTSLNFEIKPGRNFFIEHADVSDGSLRVYHFSLKLELPERIQNIIEMKLMSLVKTVDPDNRMQMILRMYNGDPFCLLSFSSIHSRLHFQSIY